MRIEPSQVRAGDLAGKVLLGKIPVKNANRLRYAGEESGHEKVQDRPREQPSENTVIYIEGAKEGTGRVPLPLMKQQDKAFVPQTLPVRVGTEVDFPNTDTFYHDVFSYSKVQSFDLGRYPQGQSRAVTFNKPGVIKVFCEIHSQMRAYILVLDTPAFTVPDSEGYFQITGVPNGKYRVVAWHPAFKPLLLDVDIIDGRTWVDIEF